MKDEKKDKKIIIDEDWKSEAQKEKEKLVSEEKKIKEEKKKPALPEASFASLVSMLATQAFFAMGVIRTEESKDTEPDMDMAKFNIDMLAMLQEKTKGNISAQEEKMVTDTLHQLRMTYVKISE